MGRWDGPLADLGPGDDLSARRSHPRFGREGGSHAFHLEESPGVFQTPSGHQPRGRKRKGLA